VVFASPRRGQRPAQRSDSCPSCCIPLNLCYTSPCHFDRRSASRCGEGGQRKPGPPGAVAGGIVPGRGEGRCLKPVSYLAASRKGGNPCATAFAFLAFGLPSRLLSPGYSSTRWNGSRASWAPATCPSTPPCGAIRAAQFLPAVFLRLIGFESCWQDFRHGKGLNMQIQGRRPRPAVEVCGSGGGGLGAAGGGIPCVSVEWGAIVHLPQ